VDDKSSNLDTLGEQESLIDDLKTTKPKVPKLKLCIGKDKTIKSSWK